MKEPSWQLLLRCIAIFVVSYLIIDIAIHRTFYWEQVTRATEAGLAGGTVGWYFARRKWQKARAQSEGLSK